MASVRIGFACAKTKQLSIARFEQFENDPNRAWWLTSARPLAEATLASSLGSIGNVRGSFYPHQEYTGCPHCGAKSFIRCGSCGRMSCWDETRMGPCGWCPANGPVAGSIESLDRVD